MSLLEWMGERYNPGPSGSFRFGRGNRPPRSNGSVLLRLCVALAVIVLLYYLVITQVSTFTLKTGAILSCILFAYCLLSYFVRPEPDTSNIGWLGGLMDNPFRYSDDINRFLLFLKILLIPGRFLAESIADGIFLLRSK